VNKHDRKDGFMIQSGPNQLIRKKGGRLICYREDAI